MTTTARNASMRELNDREVDAVAGGNLGEAPLGLGLGGLVGYYGSKAVKAVSKWLNS
jgi:hypothetical protein